LRAPFANTLLRIEAGSGGTEARDWCGILSRMYFRWAKATGVGFEILNCDGKLPRLVEINLAVPLSLMLRECGTHRLTRISPFGDGRLQTSFARVEACEIPPDREAVQILDADLVTEYFRSGGNGGQNAQKNSSAVRLTHIPTGLKACCQNERSQRQNYRLAKAVLLGRIRAALKPSVDCPGVAAGWGEAFRSYILNGQPRVKDKRSGYESAAVRDVLDGKISCLLTAGLLTEKTI